MNVAAKKKEIQRLTKLINYYNDRFFQHSESLISDYEFDMLVNKLKQLEAEFPSLKNKKSPTQHVGEKPSSQFISKYHHYPMLSLSNTYSMEEVTQFVTRVKNKFGGEELTFFCELKLDGVALSLHYEKKCLKYVLTRGDGKKGDDITANADLLLGVPSRLQGEDIPDYCEIRGEAFMYKADFAAFNKRRIARGEMPHANPRNTTAGTLKTLDGASVKDRKIMFTPYALASALPLSTHSDSLQKIINWGFNPPFNTEHCQTVEDISSYLKKLEKKRKELPMEIDGVVIKVNKLAQQQLLGYTAKSPRWAIAYKYKPDRVVSTLKKVTYQVGRTGIITPVAHLTPTLIDGSVVQRASLYNATQMKLLGLFEGVQVFIEKGGGVIPKVTGIVNLATDGSFPIQFPTQCPSCHSPCKQKGNVHYYCSNEQGCSAQLHARIIHFVSRDAMDIAFLGPQRIKLLIDQKMVHDVSDLYRLTFSNLLQLDGFKEKSVVNLLDAIEKSKKQPFERVLFALGVPHVGSTIAKKLTSHFNSLEKLQQASWEELVAIPDLGPEIAQSVQVYFQNNTHQLLLARLQEIGLQLAKVESAKQHDDSVGVQRLQGCKLVATGSFPGYTRRSLKNYLVQAGAQPMSSLSSRVDVLLVGEKPGFAKITQATQLGIPQLSLTQLMQKEQKKT